MEVLFRRIFLFHSNGLFQRLEYILEVGLAAVTGEMVSFIHTTQRVLIAFVRSKPVNIQEKPHVSFIVKVWFAFIVHKVPLKLTIVYVTPSFICSFPIFLSMVHGAWFI